MLSGVGIDAGSSVTVNSPSGILFGMPRFAYSFLGSVNYGYSGGTSTTLPTGLTINVPGAAFPTFNNVSIPSAPNVIITNDVYTPITKDTVITWTGASAGRLQITALFGLAGSPGFTRAYSCIADASTGSFSFPASVKAEIAALGSNAIGQLQPTNIAYNSTAQSSGDAALITISVGTVGYAGSNAGASARSNDQNSFWKSFAPAFTQLSTR